MPTRTTIDVARRLVVSEADGVLTDADLLTSQRELRAHPDFRRDLRQLWDFRGVERFEVTGALLRGLAQSSPFGAGTRRAVVVPTIASYGLARIFQTIVDAGGQDLEIFTDIDAAWRWLDDAAAGSDADAP